MSIRTKSICINLSLICSLSILHGCSTTTSQKPDYNAVPALADIEAEAARVDRMLEDGWIAGRESRTFKTPYALVPPRVKAQFALDYADMLRKRGQDLVRDWHTYVPYSQRALFALSWWKNNDAFLHLTLRKQDIWIHECLLDASELYWRVFERQQNPDSIHVVAHDSEQNLVSKFMENDAVAESWDDFRTKKSATSSVPSMH